MSKKRKKKSSSNQLGIGGIVIVLLISAVAYFFNIDLSEVGLDDVISNSGNFEPSNFDSEDGAVADNDSPDRVESVRSEGASWYDIYFTDPSCPPEEERHGGLDELIAEDLAQAQVQVDIAAFEFESEAMVEALLALGEQGIPVRVVTDEDYGDSPSVNRLRRHGISVVEDKRSALMHNKFIVIDGRYVWTGSMNFMSNGVHCNNNNLVRFDAPRLANNYIVEMDEMYEERAFGPTSPENTPREQLNINGVQVENYFAPEKELAPIIADAISQAQEEIFFLAFSFTHDEIGEAILERADAGLLVMGVFEKVGSNTDYSYFPVLFASDLENIDVRQDGNGRIMHHKVIILDRETVIFGSFNFSANANDSNDENIVIVHDADFASFFVEEFGVVWQEAKPE